MATGEKVLGCPVHQPMSEGMGPDINSGLDYNEYLKVSKLLALQQPQSSPAHHDELLFIIIHQAYELWFKLILHEMENAIDYMSQRKILRAHHFMNRIVQTMKLLVQQIHLLETMTPVEFLEFRDHLKPASGFQSVQFREVEFLAGAKDPTYLKFFSAQPELHKKLQARLKGPDLRDAYYSLLQKEGFDLPDQASESERTHENSMNEQIIKGILPLYQNPSKYLELYLLSESLVEFDEYLALWREHHVKVVERVIGHKRGTGGSDGVSYLKSTVSKKCFPLLWDVRTYLVKV